ncbi:hypothetical protein [Alkalibacillus haloalkaliphilus]|uniref:hypothetical protein n=1 Tax=Alkalibacillus haloalkaliphilus TaxID=94136 RepID=UPI0029363B79|nr:hypothetical protein [Alkalibacillus haloalkaliphilus]MDV2582164.1 hypothetical protein [Alkalibacillus haloalkaliphilus]
MKSQRDTAIFQTPHLITAIIAVIFLVYNISGYTSENFIYISAFMLILWSIFSLLVSPKKFTEILMEKKIIAFALFFLFFVITSLPTAGLIETSKSLGSFLILFSPMFIMSYYIRINNKFIICFILSSVLISWMIFALRSIQFYSLNPGAARTMTSSGDIYGEVAIGGGYSLAIGSAILVVFLLELFLKGKFRKISFVISIIFISLLIFLVIDTWSSITLVALIVGFFTTIAVMFSSNRDGRLSINYKSIFTQVILIIMVSVVFFNINSISYYFMGVFSESNNKISENIYNVAASIYFNNNYIYTDELSLFNRLDLISLSIQTFLTNPLLGVGYSYSYEAPLAFENGIGNHSEVFDSLAKFGLLGSIPYFFIYYYGIKANLNNNHAIMVLAYIIVIITLAVFNPFRFFHANLVIFLVIPSFLFLYKKRVEKKEC